MSLHNKIEAIPPGMWNCDINGAPVDEYVAKWRVLQVVEEHQTTAYAEGRKDEREELLEVIRAAGFDLITAPSGHQFLLNVQPEAEAP
jgi:hypothetical protein